MKRIAIIGAGCSGLAAIKCCLDEGLEPVCFEMDSDIGGLWNYSDKVTIGKGSAYKSLTINTSKEMMAFSDFPPPQHFPTFMPHRYVLKYFKMYAENFDLYRFIHFRTCVKYVRPAPDYDMTGRWDVTTSSANSEEITETFDGVLICTGHHTHPYIPDLSKYGTYTGHTLHSHGYKQNTDFAGKNVLVVGVGNSGVDIAVDLSHTASQVYLSTRRGAWVVSRKGFWGLPADAVANSRFLFTLPKSVLQWSVEKVCNFNFDHEAYGIKPQNRAFQTHPTINDELPFRIMTGAVQMKPDVHHFQEKSVHFADGSIEHIDAIIFATGYTYTVPFVDESVLRITDNDTNLYKFMFPPHHRHPTLGIVGLVQAIGAVMPISEIQCRWYTRVIKGLCRLPSSSVMMQDILSKKAAMNDVYVKTRRHTLQTFWIDIMDEIAEQIGVKPDLTKLFREDPWLALRCYFGPCLPAQFRLEGPGKWNGARASIRNAVRRCMPSRHKGLTPKNISLTKTPRMNVEIAVPMFIKSYIMLLFLIFLVLCLA